MGCENGSRSECNILLAGADLLRELGVPQHPQTSVETRTFYVYIEEIGYILSDGTRINKLVLGAIGRLRGFCVHVPEFESQPTLAFDIFPLFRLSAFDIYIL